jgi:quercetin dioxygenase-like cupin family protein
MTFSFPAKLISLVLFSVACLPLLQAEQVYHKEILVTPLLKTQTDSAGQPIAYPTLPPEVSAVIVDFPVGKETGWHIHPSPCFAYVLEGEITVEFENGTKKVVKAGEAFAEVVNLRHNGSNRGSVPAKLVMFVAGSKDTPISIKK